MFVCINSQLCGASRLQRIEITAIKSRAACLEGVLRRGVVVELISRQHTKPPGVDCRTRVRCCITYMRMRT